MEYALQWIIPSFPEYNLNITHLGSCIRHDKLAGSIGILPIDIKETLIKTGIAINAETLLKTQQIILHTAKDIFRSWELCKKAWASFLPIPD